MPKFEVRVSGETAQACSLIMRQEHTTTQVSVCVAEQQVPM